MAKLKKMPNLATISGFRGKIDFYWWCDIPCARAWPRSPGPRRAAAVEATWPPFAWAASNWKSLSPIVQDAYRQTASGSGMTGRDLFVKSFIIDYFKEGQWP